MKKRLKTKKPDMVVINETQLAGNMVVSLGGYTTWTKNRTKKGGGGIATSVNQKHKDFAVGTGEGDEEDEYLITRLECFYPALNVINSYGEQRSTRKEDIEKKWDRLRKEMEAIRLKGEFCILAGDQNKLVGSDKLGVPGNSPEVSVGGRLLGELLATGDWFLVNGLYIKVVNGGPFTRQDPATGRLSCLDLFVTSRELLPYIEKLEIDSEREFTPARAVKEKGKYKKVFTDHFSSLLTLKNLPKKKENNSKKKTVWNFSKENGWEDYKITSDKLSEKVDNLVENQELTVQEVINKFEVIHEKI